MDSSYIRNLICRVINKSEGDKWEDAVMEWEIIDCEEDERSTEICICGKENIRYLYTIRNTYNGNILFPIGSSCIKKFDRRDLKEKTSLMEDQFKLLHAVENGQFLSLSTDLFTRRLLLWLYEEGAFDSEYNNYYGKDDYDFMLKMFNKRNKEDITIAQKKKIAAIILNSIKPYLQSVLSDKVR